jgi:hypothetical protein
LPSFINYFAKNFIQELSKLIPSESEGEITLSFGMPFNLEEILNPEFDFIESLSKGCRFSVSSNFTFN